MKKIICLGLSLTMVLSSMGASCFAAGGIFDACMRGCSKESKNVNNSTRSSVSVNNSTQRSENENKYTLSSVSVNDSIKESKNVNNSIQRSKKVNNSTHSLKKVNNSIQRSKKVNNSTHSLKKVNDSNKSPKSITVSTQQSKSVKNSNELDKSFSVSDLKYVEYQIKKDDIDRSYKKNDILMKSQKMLEKPQIEFTKQKYKKEIMDKKLAIQNLENAKKYNQEMETLIKDFNEKLAIQNLENIKEWRKEIDRLSKEVENKRKEYEDEIKEREDAMKKNAEDQIVCKQNIIKARYLQNKNKLELIQKSKRLRQRSRNNRKLIKFCKVQLWEKNLLYREKERRLDKLDESEWPLENW